MCIGVKVQLNIYLRNIFMREGFTLSMLIAFLFRETSEINYVKSTEIPYSFSSNFSDLSTLPVSIKVSALNPCDAWNEHARMNIQELAHFQHFYHFAVIWLRMICVSNVFVGFDLAHANIF